MIKITFKKPQRLIQEDLPCDCIHVLAFASMYEYHPGKRGVFTSESECSLVDESNIKSIEHVKPTDL